jgi:alkaline phosphatase D
MLSRHLFHSLFAVAAIVAVTCHAAPSAPISVTHGVAAGDVTASSAVIWSRADREAFLHVLLTGPGGGLQRSAVPVAAAGDYTGKLVFKGLRPGTPYRYRVWFSADGASAPPATGGAVGSFRTAPAATQPAPVTFAWGGDLAGQNACRDAGQGFPVFRTIHALAPDFFLGLGDMIYADGVCNALGRFGNPQVPGNFPQSSTPEDFWAHWKYNREDAAYRELMAATPYYAIWDDHEVVNDFGPLHDTRNNPPYTPGQPLLPMGLQAFLAYNPVMERNLTPDRLYRSIRWGEHLELVILDNRQYRDANLVADAPELPKTMLGREQLAWLKQTLVESDATWKIIVTSVPLAIPTGFPPESGRDGWANFDQGTGFEAELLDLLTHLRDRNIHDVLFITTDVHFASVQRYTPFADTPDFQIHEYVTGPLNAGLFPNTALDTTLNPERLFFHGPASAEAVTSFTEAQRWLNFGQVAMDDNGVLTSRIFDADGRLLFEKVHVPD